MKINFLFLSLFCFLVGHSQEDYMNIIAEKSCDCIEKKIADLEQQGKIVNSTELGICLLESAKGYQDRLKEDHGLDLNNLNGETGEKLGVLLGSKMAFTCPEILVAASKTEDKNEDLTVKGTVESVSDGDFIVFNIKNESGRKAKFYWFTFVNSNFDLQNSFKMLKDKKVKVEYLEQELFDPRIKEYRIMNVLLDLEILNTIN